MKPHPMEPYNMYSMGPSRPPFLVGSVDPTPWEWQSEVRMASTVVEPPGGFGCGVQTEVRMASTTIKDHRTAFVESKRISVWPWNVRSAMRGPRGWVF